VKQNSVRPEKHLRWLAERIVKYGYLKDWKLLVNSCEINDLKEAAIDIRSLNDKDLNFLSVVLDIPKEKFRCYTLTQSNPKHWSY
jgi:hypothetical protein